nr:DNA-directed RNA polymerase subunit alpha C-terminal domain-containing protein [Rhizohabitans arisaemae]
MVSYYPPRLDLAWPIEELILTVRSYNCLKRAGIHTCGELLACSEQDLLEIEHFNPACVEEVKRKLAESGQSLRDAHSVDPAE